MRTRQGTQLDTAAVRRAFLYALLVLVAVAVPPWIAGVDPPWLATSYGRRTVAFELFGFSIATVFALIALGEWRARKARSSAEWAALAVPLGIGLHTAYLLSEFPAKPFDYDCYEYAARAIDAGANPYVTGLNYLYPPLTAQVFSALAAAVRSIASLFGFAPGVEPIWDGVFYLFQCAQLGLVVLLAVLSQRLAKRLGIDARYAPLIVGALLLFDNPLLRTLRHGQVNLWIADLALLALLATRQLPAAAGAALAVAVHIKLYPAVLALPFAVGRQWRTLVWAGVAFLGVVVVQTEFLRDWTPWTQFADFYRSVYPGEVAYRNNSFHSAAVNTLRFVFDASPREHRAAVRLAATLFSLAMGGWLLARIARRARAPEAGGDRLLADGIDALAFSLLISQSVWEHHYLLALPLALAAIARRGRERPVAVGAAIFLALAMPTFDLYPLSYHRAAGLVGLLLLTAPRAPDTRVAQAA